MFFKSILSVYLKRICLESDLFFLESDLNLKLLKISISGKTEDKVVGIEK